jgi:hypothetical protein
MPTPIGRRTTRRWYGRGRVDLVLVACRVKKPTGPIIYTIEKGADVVTRVEWFIIGVVLVLIVLTVGLIVSANG